MTKAALKAHGKRVDCICTELQDRTAWDRNVSNSCYNFNQECLVDISTKVTLGTDAEQRTYKKQFAFVNELMNDQCSGRTSFDDSESSLSTLGAVDATVLGGSLTTLGVAETTVPYGCVPLAAAEAADSYDDYSKYLVGGTDSGQAPSQVEKRSTPAWEACLPRNSRPAWRAEGPHNDERPACRVPEAECRNASAGDTIAGRDYFNDHIQARYS